MMSFSDGLLTAIISVRATRVMIEEQSGGNLNDRPDDEIIPVGQEKLSMLLTLNF